MPGASIRRIGAFVRPEPTSHQSHNDDFSYVRRDQAETSVLFELISERYERNRCLRWRPTV